MLLKILRSRSRLEAERKCLRGMIAGVGVAGEGALFAKEVLGSTAAIKRVLRCRDVDCVEISDLQAKWLHRPEVNRGSSLELGAEKFPDAQFYILMVCEKDVAGFEIYGAAFSTLLLVTFALELAFHNCVAFEDYFENQLCANLAKAVKRFPNAFTGEMYYKPTGSGEMRKIFTLPSDLR